MRSTIDSISVAIVGCGFVATDHLNAWRRIPNTDVIAVCDINETMAQQTAEQWHIPEYYTSLSTLLTHQNPTVIDICTPPHTHAPLAIQAMKADVNVLLEKPMTMTSKDALQIVTCQKQTDVKAGVIHNWLFEPTILEASSLVQKGSLGEILNVDVAVLSTREDAMAANPHHWSHKFPGGRFSEMLAHPIYLLHHFLAEEIEIGDVHVAKTGTYEWMTSDELVASFTAGHKLGRTYASFNASRDAILISLYGRQGIVQLDVINATLRRLPQRRTSRFNKGFDALRQATQLITTTVKNVAQISLGRWLSGHDMAIKRFTESLFHDSPPPVTVEDGYRVVSMVEALGERIVVAEQSPSQSSVLRAQNE